MFEALCVSPDTCIREAISKLVDGGEKTIFVVDEQRHLLGLMTNGDMRRFLLSGQPLSLPVIQAMNPNPQVFDSVQEAEKYKRQNKYIVYPIVNADGILIDALYQGKEEFRRLVSHELADVPLVIMAGGKGTRLYPYTKILPKAIIPIGKYSITERIIHSFYQYGCRQIYMVLNHGAALIKAYLNEAETNCKIDYVVEQKFLGTAGGLRLLKDKLNSTFILSNCDILINDDLTCAYKTHLRQKNQITYICSMKNITVPYGVIETSADGQVRSITEKPQISFLANTGVYVLEPEILQEIGEDEVIHITELTERCLSEGMRVGVFPVSEQSWLDMGQIEEMEHMIQKLEDKK